jgi:hypothetical protein
LRRTPRFLVCLEFEWDRWIGPIDFDIKAGFASIVTWRESERTIAAPFATVNISNAVQGGAASSLPASRIRVSSTRPLY